MKIKMVKMSFDEILVGGGKKIIEYSDKDADDNGDDNHTESEANDLFL